jgi:hypothetical protein
MTSTKRRIATILSLIALSVAGMAMASTASAASTISGVVYKDGVRQPNATVSLFRWTQSTGWFRTKLKVVTNSTGRYTFTGLPDGAWFQPEGYKTFGSCWTGLAIYRGYGRYFQTTGAASGANVNLGFEQWFYC